MSERALGLDSAVCRLDDEVKGALSEGKPVVAFETTVLSFGLPFPHNVEVGLDCERITRDTGVVPATLGMVDGKVRAGLSADDLRRFCVPNSGATKVNLQNIAAVAVGKGLGAFTVAASTQVCAGLGIRVFATGGIGGVHRDYAETHDVSSDLLALSRFPVAVVCSGVKSILDIPATLEHLESRGVPIVGYRAPFMPLFYARESNFPLEVNFEEIGELAEMVRLHWQLGGRGVLIVTPVPEEFAVGLTELEDWIAGAHRAARYGRVSGKDVTPFLLKKVQELSQGRSITTNLALLRNNARVAAELARALGF